MLLATQQRETELLGSAGCWGSSATHATSIFTTYFHHRGSPGYRCNASGDSSLPKRRGASYTCEKRVQTKTPAVLEGGWTLPHTCARTLRSSETVLAPGPSARVSPGSQRVPGSEGPCVLLSPALAPHPPPPPQPHASVLTRSSR